MILLFLLTTTTSIGFHANVDAALATRQITKAQQISDRIIEICMRTIPKTGQFNIDVNCRVNDGRNNKNLRLGAVSCRFTFKPNTPPTWFKAGKAAKTIIMSMRRLSVNVNYHYRTTCHSSDKKRSSYLPIGRLRCFITFTPKVGVAPSRKTHSALSYNRNALYAFSGSHNSNHALSANKNVVRGYGHIIPPPAPPAPLYTHS
ncbi:hypothetical protein PFISCL1PPCAC_21945, partial [Pristionchus fissidentatus]